MGKRYYCDFCDKSFADNPTSRKNHLKGVHHQRNRKAHYDSFRNPEIILDEELSKRPCKTFLSTGTCQFMDNCRFSHLTEEKRQDLELQITKKQKLDSSQEPGNFTEESDEAKKMLNPWLDEYHKRHAQSNKETEKTVVPQKLSLPDYVIPPHLLAVPNPPPSLLPPPPAVFDNLPLLEWG